MNKIILLGRLVKDPELRHSENGDKVYTKFTIAVQRNFRLPDGVREADFIPIRVFGKKAEVIVKYMKKGSLMTVSGRLRTGSYEDESGNRKYISEVVAEDFKFIENRKTNQQASES
jgi:single-strand DNA-binding protein